MSSQQKTSRKLKKDRLQNAPPIICKAPLHAMKILKLLSLVIVALLVGAWLGAWHTSRIMWRMKVAKPEVDMSFLAAQEADWAALLRLGETKSTIAVLEKA